MPSIAIVSSNSSNDEIFLISRDNCHDRFIVLKDFFKKKGWECHTHDLLNSNQTDIYLYINIKKRQIPKLLLRSRKKKILLVYEPKMLRPLNHSFLIRKLFNNVIGWSEKNSNFIGPGTYVDKKLIETKKIVNSKRNKKAVFICSNKNSTQKNELYSLRRKIISFFAERNDNFLELYGFGWQEDFKTLNLKNIYKGEIKSKNPTMIKYDFAFAIENEYSNEDYFTEKILDAMICGCIPIYFGCNNIDKYIPKDLYIDLSKFENLISLKKYLLKLTEEEILNLRKRIIEFVSRNLYDNNIFSEAWAKDVANHCQKLYNKT